LQTPAANQTACPTKMPVHGASGNHSEAQNNVPARTPFLGAARVYHTMAEFAEDFSTSKFQSGAEMVGMNSDLFDRRSQEKSSALHVSRCARSARNGRIGPLHFVISTSAARRNLLRSRFLAALAPLETTESALSTLSFRPAQPGEIFCAPGFSLRSLRSKRQNRPSPLCHFDQRGQEKSSALQVSRSARNDRTDPIHFVISTGAARRNLLRSTFLAALAPLETTESALSTLSFRPAQPGEIFCAPGFSLRSLRSKRQNRPSPLCHPTSAARRNLLRPRFLVALAPLETTKPALFTKVAAPG